MAPISPWPKDWNWMNKRRQASDTDRRKQVQTVDVLVYIENCVH